MSEAQKDHDAVCVDIVEKISELGGFQVEFPVYLTCYVENGMCMYYVSSDRMQVYQFIYAHLKEDLYCIPPVRKSMHCIVSSGQKEELYQRYKVIAAKELMQEGAGEIARQLIQLAPKQTNEAQELLERLRVGLKGVFHTEKRQLYRGLLDMAYHAKKINGMYYMRTLEWLDLEEQQLEEERIVHAVHERTYSGFAYYKVDGSLGYYTNAVQEGAIARRDEMMQSGVIVSPILTKRYCFSDISSIGSVAETFKTTLKQNINRNFMQLVDIIYAADNICDGQIDQEIKNAVAEGNTLKERTLTYYKALWQV